MLWEADDNTIKKIKLSGKKIVEIFDEWYIDRVIYPDGKNRDKIHSLIITIKRDSSKEN